LSDIEKLKQQVAGGANPRDIKFLLGEEIVDRFHGTGAGARARDNFVARFQQGAMPEDIVDVVVAADLGGIPIANLLKDAGLTQSTSEAIRMIKQGAVRIDGERLDDAAATIPVGATHVVQVGKRRFARVSTTPR
jgi:tyrosyl-tRNA synthetase